MIWTEEDNALLGTMTDRELADMLGTTLGVVYYQRRKLNIEPYGTSVNRLQWTPEMEAILGTDTDLTISKELGISSSSVQLRRESLGISAYGPGSNNKPIKWTDEMDAFLGTDIDRKIAKRLGLSRRTIEKRRHELGIASYMEDNRIIPLHLSGQDTEAKRIYQEKRRQKKLTLDDTLTNKQWVFALDFFGHRCAYCGSNNSLEEEHIVPVSKDGAREASNIIPACSSCNSSKRDKDLSDWLNSRFTKRDVKTVTKRIDEYISATFNGGSAP